MGGIFERRSPEEREAAKAAQQRERRARQEARQARREARRHEGWVELVWDLLTTREARALYLLMLGSALGTCAPGLGIDSGAARAVLDHLTADTADDTTQGP